MHIGFHLLTSGTAGNVISDKSGHRGPPVITLSEVKGFEVAQVSGGWVIMVKF